MDGRGRAFDNIFVERLWRNVKYEDVYLKGYASMSELRIGLGEYLTFYNDERPHQSLAFKTPDAVYQTATGGGAKIVDKYPREPEESPDRVRGSRKAPVCPQNRAYGSVHGSSCNTYPLTHIKPMLEQSI